MISKILVSLIHVGLIVNVGLKTISWFAHVNEISSEVLRIVTLNAFQIVIADPTKIVETLNASILVPRALVHIMLIVGQKLT